VNRKISDVGVRDCPWRSDAGNGEAVARARRIGCLPVLAPLQCCGGGHGSSPSHYRCLRCCSIPSGGGGLVHPGLNRRFWKRADIGHPRPRVQRRKGQVERRTVTGELAKSTSLNAACSKTCFTDRSRLRRLVRHESLTEVQELQTFSLPLPANYCPTSSIWAGWLR